MFRYILICGFTIFSMFFGSGNLVFPLKIGVESEVHWLSGFLGLFLTGILLPFLGLFVIKLHQGSYQSFFSEIGSRVGNLLPLLILSLLGSFGVVPRCIAVAHGGIEYLMPQISLTVFSFIFCATCFVVCIRDSWLFSALGKWMSPILLLCLAFLIILGVYSSDYAMDSLRVMGAKESFTTGFLQGYETMDLFAAFFFSSLVFNQVKAQMGTRVSEKEIFRITIWSSIIGVMLLSLTYMGFVYMGASYKFLLSGISAEVYLPSIAMHLLGPKMVFVVGIIILLSCLTTAVSLNHIYAKYLQSLLRVNEKWFPGFLFLTTSISFLMSLLDFRGITNFLSPILEVSYPSLIVLTCSSIFLREYHALKKWLFYGTLLMVLSYKMVV